MLSILFVKLTFVSVVVIRLGLDYVSHLAGSDRVPTRDAMFTGGYASCWSKGGHHKVLVYSIVVLIDL